MGFTHFWLIRARLVYFWFIILHTIIILVYFLYIYSSGHLVRSHLGIAIFSNVETIFSGTCNVSGRCISNILRYFSILLFTTRFLLPAGNRLIFIALFMVSAKVAPVK